MPAKSQSSPEDVQSRHKTHSAELKVAAARLPQHSGIWKVVDADGPEVSLKTRNLKSEKFRKISFLS